MEWSISILAAVAFYSKIVIKKLDGDQLKIYGKVEDCIKSLILRKVFSKHCSRRHNHKGFMQMRSFEDSYKIF